MTRPMTPDTIRSLLGEYRRSQEKYKSDREIAAFDRGAIAALERLLADVPAAPVAPGDEEIVGVIAPAVCEFMDCEVTKEGCACTRAGRSVLSAIRPLLARQSTRRTDEEVEREIERIKGQNFDGLSKLDPLERERLIALRWTLNKTEPGQ